MSPPDPVALVTTLHLIVECVLRTISSGGNKETVRRYCVLHSQTGGIGGGNPSPARSISVLQPRAARNLSDLPRCLSLRLPGYAWTWLSSVGRRVDRGAAWDWWGGAVDDPSAAAFLQRVTVSVCTFGGGKGSRLVWVVVGGGEDWQKRVTRTEEAISRNTASRKSVIRMPKEGCISFIAGQTEQPGVEGPLEDNIP